MDKGQIILDELNEWIYNDENQAGDKLQIIDASDIPTIIDNLVKKLTIPDVIVRSEQFICSQCGKATKEWLDGMCEDCTLESFTGK